MKKKKITIILKDLDAQLVHLIEYIKKLSDPGHSFSVLVDPDSSENKKSFYMDGDGSFSINEITVKEIESTGGIMGFTETLQSPLTTVNGKRLRKGLNVKIRANTDGTYKVSSKNKSYIVTHGNLIKAMIPEDNISVGEFIRDSTKGKVLTRSRTKVKASITSTIGPKITPANRKKALALMQDFLSNKKLCPKCGTSMIATEIAGNKRAWNCPNDRVTLPYI